jgi:CBS-domain-containing membrane protein
MVIRDCMKRRVFCIKPTATIREAVSLFLEHHIGTLPVVDSHEHLVGLLLLRNVLSLVMPDFTHLLEDFDFITDFGAAENHSLRGENLKVPVSKVMEEPISVEESSGLLRTSALINQENLVDIPVVDSENKLVGIASRVDIGTALLTQWGLDKGA